MRFNSSCQQPCGCVPDIVTATHQVQHSPPNNQLKWMRTNAIQICSC
jgi:hypothetical protein